MTTALAPPVPARALNASRVLLLVLLTLIGVSLLVGLGVWQLERRAWKVELIRKVESRAQAAVHEIPASAAADPQSQEYEHVEITGTYLTGRDTWVHASTELGAGYWVMTPLRTAEGATVLINRGFVSMDVPRDAVRQESTAHVTGLLRASESSGAWPRRNEPARDRWYSRDVAAIGSARGLQQVRPYFVDAQPGGDARNARGPAGSGSVQPVAGLTVVHFRNAHLSYALTWFALALMTATAGIYAIRGEMSGRARRP